RLSSIAIRLVRSRRGFWREHFIRSDRRNVGVFLRQLETLHHPHAYIHYVRADRFWPGQQQVAELSNRCDVGFRAEDVIPERMEIVVTSLTDPTPIPAVVAMRVALRESRGRVQGLVHVAHEMLQPGDVIRFDVARSVSANGGDKRGYLKQGI